MSEKKTLNVAVAGGGIAGLACACACALRGFRVRVYEQSQELGDIGAGLQISPNGWKVLAALGLAEKLAHSLFEPPTIEMRLGASGRRIWTQPIAQMAKDVWRGRYIHIHRADLTNALAERLSELAPDALRLGQPVNGYELGETLSVTGADETPDVLVGADGIHSSIRRRMLGSARPEYTGNLAWRTIVPVDALGTDAPPPNATVWVGAGCHVVTTRLRGGALVNFAGLVERPEPAEEGWRVTGHRDTALADFKGFARPIQRLLQQAETLHRWALFTRAPLPRWSDGPVVLIGDAAHPMLPSMAQGAVQALEDAWVLAALLEAHGDGAKAGKAFYKSRIERTGRIQALSASNARMFHRAGVLGSPIYYGGMAAVTRLAPSVLRARQDWIYAHDVVADWPLEAS